MDSDGFSGTDIAGWRNRQSWLERRRLDMFREAEKTRPVSLLGIGDEALNFAKTSLDFGGWKRLRVSWWPTLFVTDVPNT